MNQKKTRLEDELLRKRGEENKKMTPPNNLEDELFADDEPSKEEIDNQNFEKFMQYGHQDLEVKDYENALIYFTKAHKIKKKDFNVWLGLGKAYNGISFKYNEAKKAFRNATHLNPQSDEAWLGYGYNEINGTIYDDDEKDWHDGGTLESAIVAFDKALAINPNNEETLVTMGDSLIKYTSTVPRALDSWRKATIINPKNTHALYQLAIFSRDGNEKNKWADKLLRIEPHNTKAWNVKGNALSILERYSEAKQAYQKAGNFERVHQLDKY